MLLSFDEKNLVLVKFVLAKEFLPSGKGKSPPLPACCVCELVICWPLGRLDDQPASGLPNTIDNNKNNNNPRTGVLGN